MHTRNNQGAIDTAMKGNFALHINMGAWIGLGKKVGYSQATLSIKKQREQLTIAFHAPSRNPAASRPFLVSMSEQVRVL